MSLDWSLSDIKDYKTVCWIPDNEEREREGGDSEAVKLHPVTHTLIWNTISAGIGRLTEENLDEFAYRVFFWEKIFGAQMRRVNQETKQFEEVSLTYEEIKAHVGLRTNVSMETRKVWEKRMKDVVMREFGWQAKRLVEDGKKEANIEDNTKEAMKSIDVVLGV